MADPKEPFNERGHTALARVVEKADRLREKLPKHQERLRPLRLARSIEKLHRQERPVPSLDMTTRDRAADLKRRAEREVAGKEASERARLERARMNEMHKAASRQTQSGEKTQAAEEVQGIEHGSPMQPSPPTAHEQDGAPSLTRIWTDTERQAIAEAQARRDAARSDQDFGRERDGS